MNTTEFKKAVSEVKTQLKGLTLQVVDGNNAAPHYSLNSFGKAILAIEESGLSISITQVWTSTGILRINSFNHFAEVLSSASVTGVQFKSFRSSETITDYLRNEFKTTE